MRWLKHGQRGWAITLGFACASFWAMPACGQWVDQYEQFYLPAKHNWVFRENYSGADRLFNAFDYGHAILYEELYTHPEGPVERLEVDRYNFITQHLLRRPPRLPLEEAAIEIQYVKLVPEAKLMFEWAHLLHRQAYDILADERLSQADRDREMAQLIAYYNTRPDLAFSTTPKSMNIMDGQYYSLGFRHRYPKFNGLIWAYHWLQVGLYEPLMVNTDVESRTKGVNATVARFWQMLEDPPKTMPYLMPMSAGIAPAFSRRYPEAAIIFDNLHMMHDVVSDILVSEQVPRDRKRAEILKTAAEFRDSVSYAITRDEWFRMGEMMGARNMGGPAVSFMEPLPRPDVERGASMAGMEHGALQQPQPMHMQQDTPPAQRPHAPAHEVGKPAQRGQQPAHGEHHAPGHGAQPAQGHGIPHGRGHCSMMGSARAHAGGHDGNSAGPQHGTMQMHGDTGMAMCMTCMGGMHGGMQMDSTMMRQVMQMHQRIMADPVIRERIATDPVLRNMMKNLHCGMPMQGTSMQPPGSQGMSESEMHAHHAKIMQFISRLLADPGVQERIREDPELRRLSQDPEIRQMIRN